MVNKRSTTLNNTPDYSYLQHFQVAVVNLDNLIQEERLLKRIRRAKLNSECINGTLR